MFEAGIQKQGIKLPANQGIAADSRLDMNQAVDGLLRRPALRMEKSRAVITLDNGDRSFSLQDLFQPDQCLDRIPQMFKDETDEYMVEGFRFERKVKNIGKALDGKISITCVNHPDIEVLEKNAEVLRELINVSQLTVSRRGMGIPGSSLETQSSHADGQKCERCWHWEMDIGKNPEHPTICGRCIEAVKQFKA